MRIGESITNRSTSSSVSTAASQGTSVAEAQNPVTTTELKKGDVLEGKVVANNRDGSLTLKTSDGKEVQVKVAESNDSLPVGKSLRLQLEDVSQTVKIGKLIPSVSIATNVLDSAVDNIIKSFGEVPGALQRSVVKAMVQFDVPLTKENYKAIQNEGKYAQKLGDLLSSHPELGASLDLRAEVKSILVKLLSNSVQTSQQVSTAQQEGVSGANTTDTPDLDFQLSDGKSSLKGPTVTMPEGSKSGVAQLNVVGEASKKGAEIQEQNDFQQDLHLLQNKAISSSEISQMSGQKREIPLGAQSSSILDLEPTGSQAASVSIDHEGQVKFEKVPQTLGKTEMLERDGNAVKSEIIQSLKEHSADKTAFFKKISLDATLSNIVTFNRLLINKQSMVGSFQDVLSNLKDLGITQDGDVRQLLVKLSNLDHKDLEGHIQVLNQLTEKVAEMKVSHGNQLDSINEQLNLLKSDFDFIKNINENLVYYQMPMHYQEGTGQLEVAYKKRKKDPSEGHKILISLDTKNIGQIQALVELKGKNVKINFRVPNEEIKRHFEEQFEGLKDVISAAIEVDQQGPQFNVELGIILRESPLSAMDLFREEVPHLSAFDLSI